MLLIFKTILNCLHKTAHTLNPMLRCPSSICRCRNTTPCAAFNSNQFHFVDKVWSTTLTSFLSHAAVKESRNRKADLETRYEGFCLLSSPRQEIYDTAPLKGLHV